MLDRRATVIAITLTAFGLGGGGAFAATHGGSHVPARHPQAHTQIRPPKLVSGLVKVHVCHPGRTGSMLDSLN